MYPWKFHSLTQRDMVGELLRVYNDSVIDITNPAQTSINRAFQVPDERFLLLMGWAIEAIGTAVGPDRGTIFVELPANGDTIWRQTVRFAPLASLAAGISGGVSSNIPILCPPRAQINLTTFFSGVVSGGQTSVYSVTGMFLPRGDLSSF